MLDFGDQAGGLASQLPPLQKKTGRGRGMLTKVSPVESLAKSYFAQDVGWLAYGPGSNALTSAKGAGRPGRVAGLRAAYCGAEEPSCSDGTA